MDPLPIAMVAIGALIFYLAASRATYFSFAFYGAITFFLVGMGLVPLLFPKEEEPVAPSRKKKR